MRGNLEFPDFLPKKIITSTNEPSKSYLNLPRPDPIRTFWHKFTLHSYFKHSDWLIGDFFNQSERLKLSKITNYHSISLPYSFFIILAYGVSSFLFSSARLFLLLSRSCGHFLALKAARTFLPFHDDTFCMLFKSESSKPLNL